MADEQTTVETTEETPRAAETTATEATASTTAKETPQTVEELRAELEREREMRRKANAESAGRRKRLEELEKAEDERRKATLSETEKAAERATAAEAQRDQIQATLHAERIERAVERHAAELGFEYPEDVVRLADLSDVEITDEGKVKGVKQAVEALAKARPGLLRAKGADRGTPTGGRGNPRPGPDHTTETEAAVLRRSGRYAGF